MKKFFFLTALLCASMMMFADQATMKYTGTTTSNMSIEDNNAAIVGLDANLFNVTAFKGSANNAPGLNKAGDFRLYAHKDTGDGNSIVVTLAGGVIDKITIDYKQNKAHEVKAGDVVVTGTDGVFTINAASFSIKNVVTGASDQVQINSIVIDYTLGGGQGGDAIDWSKLEWLGNGSGNDAYTNKFKISVPEGVNVVNLQNSFGTEAGIYITLPAAPITACSLGEGKWAEQGAGMLLYLTAFTQKETEVTVTANGVDYKLVVYYEDGKEGGDDPQPQPKALKGDYKIGGEGADYATLAAAIEDLEANGMEGDVNLLICADLNEDKNIGITNNTDYKLTIRPDKAEARTIQYGAQADNEGPSGNIIIGAKMALDFNTTLATKNVFIDGSIDGEGQYLTIKAGQVGGVAVVFYGDVTNSALRNCKVYNERPSGTSYAVHFRSEKGTDNAPKGVVVENCLLQVINVANTQVVYFNGSQSSTADGKPTDCVLRNNEIVSNLRGVFFNGAKNAVIEGNTFRMPSASGGFLAHGIMGNVQSGTIIVRGNKFIEMASNNANAGDYGIQAVTASGGAEVWIIENNYFAGLNALGAVADKAIKLDYVRCGDSCVVRHNTFYIPELTNTPATELVVTNPITCLYLAGAKLYPVENNIFVSAETKAKNSLIRGGLNENVKNNVFYHAGGEAVILAGAEVLADSAAFFANDANAGSVWKAVNFVDAAKGDLALTGASDGDTDLGVARLEDVLKDINGTDRAETTYAGAFEGTPLVQVVDNGPIIETYFALPGWVAETDSKAEWDAENKLVKVSIANDKNSQWFAQVKLKDEFEYKADKYYDFALPFKANKAVNNVTIKIHDNNGMVDVKNVALPENEDYVWEMKNVKGRADGNGVFVLDFGFATAGTEIIVDWGNFVITEKDEKDPEPQIELKTGQELYNVPGASLSSTWFANSDWKQETESSATFNEQTGDVTVNIAVDKSSQWQAQVKIATGAVFAAENQYQLVVKMKANADINGVTVKLQDADDYMYLNNSVSLEANEEMMLVAQDLQGKVGNDLLIFDFGFAKAGNVIEIYDISIICQDCPEGTGLDNIEKENILRKYIEDGVIFIEANGEVYTVTGVKVK